MAKTEAKEESGKPNYSPIYRSEKNRILGGVCGGLGQYFGIDPTILRIIFVLLTVFGGSGLLIYLVLWLILPAESQTEFNKDHLKNNMNEVKDKVNQFAHDLGRSTREGRVRAPEQRNWLAFIVILLGVIFLLNNFGFGDLINIGRLWPLILVALGVSLILRR
jgi:phage shock protein C